MSPVEICKSPPEIVLTRLNRTCINIDEQLRDAVLDRCLDFGSTNWQLTLSCNFHFVCSGFESDWQLDRECEQSTTNLQRLRSRIGRLDGATRGNCPQVQQCNFVLPLRQWRSGNR